MPTGRIMLFPVLLALLSGCATGSRPEGAVPRPESVTGIVLQVAPENLEGSLEPGQIEQIATQIARNLASWGYPVTAGETASAAYSHRLEGRVGKVVRGNTPPGFSMSLGNSDPRAVEFQKADVVEITCRLSALAHPDQAMRLSGSFTADSGLHQLIGSRQSQLAPAFYVDRIGTVCLNLLAELRVPSARGKESNTAPAWVPEVRVEIRNKPAGSTATAPPAPRQKTLTPTAPATAEPVSPAAEEAAKPTESPITTETRTGDGDSRKQVIIHNRGVPVILEFGYERK